MIREPQGGPKVLLVWLRDLAPVSRASDRREYGATVLFYGEQESVLVIDACLLHHGVETA